MSEKTEQDGVEIQGGLAGLFRNWPLWAVFMATSSIITLVAFGMTFWLVTSSPAATPGASEIAYRLASLWALSAGLGFLFGTMMTIVTWAERRAAPSMVLRKRYLVSMTGLLKAASEANDSDISDANLLAAKAEYQKISEEVLANGERFTMIVPGY